MPLRPNPQPIPLMVKEADGTVPPKTGMVHLVPRTGGWNVEFQHKGHVRCCWTETNDPKAVRARVKILKGKIDNAPMFKDLLTRDIALMKQDLADSERDLSEMGEKHGDTSMLEMR